LLDRFSTDVVMSTYLIVYIAGHLVAYVLLDAALRRAQVIPGWAAWSLIASSPLTVAAFVLPGSPRALGAVAVSLLVLGSPPATRRMLSDQFRTVGYSK
jgi:multidrug transporter EmrE-like cation transporter